MITDKKLPGKSKEEQIAEKKKELEDRLLDVNHKIGPSKKAPKKGNSFFIYCISLILIILSKKRNLF